MKSEPQSSLISYRSSLLLILLLALILRAGWGLRRPGASQLSALPDQVEYLELAQNLLNHHRFFFYDNRQNIQEEVRAYRTPGYPLFLAACGADVRVARLIQACIGALTALAAYLLARQWLSNKAGLFAALFIAVNPFLIYFSGLILSETLYTGMLAWAMVLLAHRTNGRFRSMPSLAGLLLLALAVLVRPSGLFLPILMAVGCVLLNRPEGQTYESLGPGERRRIDSPTAVVRMPLSIFRTVTAAIILTGLVLLPWAVRNHRLLGQWIWTTTNGGITLYDGFNPTATGASDQTFLKRMPQVRYPRMNEVERSHYFSDLARQWAMEHPIRSLKLAAAKIARTWSPVPLSREYGGRTLYVLAGAIFAIPLDLLILLGLVGGRLSWRVKLFLLLPAFYFTVIHGLSVGSLRYRMPMAAPMAVLGGCGLAMIFCKVRRGNCRA